MRLGQLIFLLKSLRQRLWLKPLGYAVLSVLAVAVAHLADSLPVQAYAFEISFETLEKLLTIISSSMLGVATLAVASMVSAYASASQSATPRAFVLVIADGFSQTALSSFIAAFIFGIVGIIAVKIGYLGVTGRFTIFLMTLALLGWVLATFVTWVDAIARLGRMGNTIEKVEAATRDAFRHWPASAPLCGVPGRGRPDAGTDGGAVSGTQIHAACIGFVQHIDIEALDTWARRRDAAVHLHAVPGTLIGPQRVLLTVVCAQDLDDGADVQALHDAFVISDSRTFAVDPRFGLIALSEIGSRAMSPGVNDPGTAIDVVVRAGRILSDWNLGAGQTETPTPDFTHVHVPPLNPHDLLEDAFAAIIKDGAGSVELGIWVQKILGMLRAECDDELSKAAAHHARQALQRAETALSFAPDLARVRKAAQAAD